MEGRASKHAYFLLAFLLSWLGGFPAAGQQPFDVVEVPSQFKLDMQAAARLRPQLIAQSVPVAGRYAAGGLVFNRLVEQVAAPTRAKFSWELRIVDNHDLNAYSSPDGTVYVESGLARLAGASTGLWAAILSHEIAHIVRRDWARRYLYQKRIENNGGLPIMLGDPGMPSSSWETSEKASADMARFCRQLELGADLEGLILMARAGYHPDFVPALHHLLHAQGVGTNSRSLYAMHPCWEERDRELSQAYLAASIEFEHLWPEWYASPGGNPPVVVFAEEPTVRRTGPKEWEVQIPMRCQNLAGAVEVVLHAGSSHGALAHPERLPDQPGSGGDARQLTGCTSPKTTVTFTLAEPSLRPKQGAQWTDIYVLDAWGSVLARADLPKLPR
ncbi:MAG TPA: M48 family metalloprotease [Candidatus Sulfotelmatobacter sp.]|nr:M48 family metalloprotease [Candidatus Sulfotelmatobacter sp.]